MKNRSLENWTFAFTMVFCCIAVFFNVLRLIFKLIMS